MTALEKIQSLPPQEGFLILGLVDLLLFCDIHAAPTGLVISYQVPPRVIQRFLNTEASMLSLRPVKVETAATHSPEQAKLNELYDTHMAKAAKARSVALTLTDLYTAVRAHREQRASDAAFLRALKMRQFRVSGSLQEVLVLLHEDMAQQDAPDQRTPALQVQASTILHMIDSAKNA